MTPTTRRWLFLSVLVVLLTLPAETMLLRALSAPSEEAATQDWAASLDSASLQKAASQIQNYPFAYRKAILKASSPDQRSAIWHAHWNAYLQAHPQLDPAAVDALGTIAALATPDFFDQPTDAGRQTLHAAADQIVSALGRDEAEYLLFYLGPKDGTFASFEPLSMKMENRIRDLVTLHAFDQWCDCAMYWGCSDWRYYCSNHSYCQEPSGYPLCGWLFMDRCDGGCEL